MSVNGYEFYETPQAFTKWLFMYESIQGRIFEPCVGAGAIPRAADAIDWVGKRRWVTNDIDPRWPADFHLDAMTEEPFACASADEPIDWVVSNTHFTGAIKVAQHALQYARVGVALHLRSSIHEVLKTGPRRTWMAEHRPTGILHLPRWAYQRSTKSGDWRTDQVHPCWVIWRKGERDQFIDYAPEFVLEWLEEEAVAYRARMDRLNAERDAEREAFA